ncbi:hypothetical protein DL767_009132 [Monosporascus sp. MG133]|nr:hypothetical protein DL767_009132 [Monosporascus sp. MG133]
MVLAVLVFYDPSGLDTAELGFSLLEASSNVEVKTRKLTFSQFGRRPFAIPTLRSYQILVSSPEQVQELSQLPKDVLSFHGAMKDRLDHKATMYGFELDDTDPNNSVPTHACKILLRKNLQNLGPVIAMRVHDAFEAEISKAKQQNGNTTLPVLAFLKALTARVNSQVFFGDEYATDEGFLAATKRYGWDCIATMEICRLLPGFIAPFVPHAIST